MEEILVSLGICMVMPVAIVWIVCHYKAHKTDKNAEVLLKAIEKGLEIKPEMFANADGESGPLKLRLLRKLQYGILFLLVGVGFLVSTPFMYKYIAPILPVTAGVILLAIGVAFTVVFFIGKKLLSAEIKAEEDNL